ncbi:lipoprotein, PulS/OutS family, partial [Escherichia coli]|nr:lipoprotein, PulS/OutS family [Escherichia coli]
MMGNILKKLNCIASLLVLVTI